jgi:predicted nucleic acid-binding protein
VRVLLDTCVLSELRRPKGDPGVRRAVESIESDELFVSVLSAGEITKGIAALKECKKKRALQAWLQARSVTMRIAFCRWIWKPAISGENSQPRRRSSGRLFPPLTV